MIPTTNRNKAETYEGRLNMKFVNIFDQAIVRADRIRCISKEDMGDIGILLRVEIEGCNIDGTPRILINQYDSVEKIDEDYVHLCAICEADGIRINNG